ncbi:MAG TPA: hypothetical protein DDZ78_00790, partial [Porphyromonadaceae bacterium]|nr:hypothetical protein [Porphyromonadaceae bacterium]
MKKHLFSIIYLTCLFALFGSCKNDDTPDTITELPEEYYTGGKLGTTSVNDISTAFEQPTPAVEDNAEMSLAFQIGESFFEDEFNSNTSGV